MSFSRRNFLKTSFAVTALSPLTKVSAFQSQKTKVSFEELEKIALKPVLKKDLIKR